MHHIHAQIFDWAEEQHIHISPTTPVSTKFIHEKDLTICCDFCTKVYITSAICFRDPAFLLSTFVRIPLELLYTVT